ncbi:DUF1461 domain-containing protein [Candidatus Woesearchaeota archaeon]|nr:DUF1461 domain-containing protein [Candidatus Woesearchaeota archaeon]
MRKLIGFSLMVCVMLLIPVFIVLSTFQSILIDDTFFFDRFGSYGIYAKLPSVDVNGFHQELVEYLISAKGQREFDSGILNSKEKSHLLDVKFLIQKALLIWKASALGIILAIFLFISLEKSDIGILRYLVAVFSIGSIITILLIAVFSALIFLKFDSAFVSFHEILFSNDNWMLDPHHDNLKAIYADEIFQDFAVKMAAKSFLYSIFLLAVSIAIFKYSGKRVKSNEVHHR